MARRRDRLDAAVAEAGPGAMAVACDVRSAEACRSAVDEATGRLGGLDALIYAAGIGPLARLVDTTPDMWRDVLETNVVGASAVTAAALASLRKCSGTAIYLSSVSASVTPPWPGLGAYAVSKAALDKLVEAWRGEEPDVGFTRLVVGECTGGEGDSMSGFAGGWDPDLAAEMGARWVDERYMDGTFVPIEDLIGVVETLVVRGAGLTTPTVIVRGRP